MKKRIVRTGAYAAITAENKILLSKLNRGPHKGRWSLPGGGIDFGEHPEQTVVRELFEEAGLKISEVPPLWRVMSGVYDDRLSGVDEELHIMGIIYRFQWSAIVPCKADGDGDSSDGCAWLDVRSLGAGDVTPFVHEILKTI